MTFFVEARGVRLKSMFCIYGREWESTGIESAEFPCESEAIEFARDCDASDEVKVHEYRVRRAGENDGFFHIR
jgi:hypothetical protein